MPRSDPRWEPFCASCGAAMRVAGSPEDRRWACGRCAEDALLEPPAVRPLRREGPALRRLPQASRTRDRHAVLLSAHDGEQRGQFDGPLPLWLQRGGRTYVIDFAPRHEGSDQVWVYRATWSRPAGPAAPSIPAHAVAGAEGSRS